MMTTVLLAQDDPQEPEKAEQPEKADKPKPEAEPAKERQEEIRRIVIELKKELGGEHDELLSRVIEQLEQHGKKDAEIVVVKSDHGARFLPFGPRLMIRPDGAETMNGTFDDDGRKGKYTLKSTGGGRYQLEAEIEGDGDSYAVKDEGTYAGLRAKYKWLRGGWMFTPRDNALTIPLRVTDTKAQPVVGVLVRPPVDALRHHLEIPVGAGLVVESVTPGSRAEQLGLRKYDVLLRIDGELVETTEQVKKLAGKDVTLEYIRRAQKKRLVTE
jgi:hypothetical protein